MSRARPRPTSLGSRWVPPAPGIRPPLRLRKSQPGGPGPDPQRARQRQFQPAAQREALDYPDGRLVRSGQAGQRVPQLLAVGREHGQARGSHQLDIRAGGKEPVQGRANDQHLGIRYLELIERPVEAFSQRRTQRVGRGAVQGRGATIEAPLDPLRRALDAQRATNARPSPRSGNT
jgi:hypothetical protein